MSTHQKAYRYRLQPTPEQESVFVQWAGARRYIWNWLRHEVGYAAVETA